MKTIAGTFLSVHISSIFSVPTEREPLALVTMIALSATESAETTSPSKSKKPGQSRMLILFPFQFAYATARLIEIFLLISSASKSIVVLPSSTLPRRSMLLALNNIASASEVLPSPEWPIKAILRIISVVTLLIFYLLIGF